MNSTLETLRKLWSLRRRERDYANEQYKAARGAALEADENLLRLTLSEKVDAKKRQKRALLADSVDALALLDAERLSVEMQLHDARKRIDKTRKFVEDKRTVLQEKENAFRVSDTMLTVARAARQKRMNKQEQTEIDDMSAGRVLFGRRE